MEKYTCLIVDDEQDAIDYLETLVAEECPTLKTVATATSSKEALKSYFKTLPDLIFLDIQIDEKNGFDILQELYHTKLKPHIIFVTAYNHYAIEAFKTNALDYLLKPVAPEELRNAVQKFMDYKAIENQQQRIEKFINQFPQKIRFNTRTGFILLHTNDILYCEADRNYTKVFTSLNTFEIVSGNLSEIEKKLNKKDFWRISRSVLANSRYLVEVDRKQKAAYLRYQGQSFQLPVSLKMIKML